MSKNTLTMKCSCGNKKAWLITVKGGYSDVEKTYKALTYFICCGDCDAEIELGGFGRAG
jgi:hypothetical protein